jgi:DNA-binding MarR family transcriptional regulator/GNAT superfamily N-acetyltransferase
MYMNTLQMSSVFDARVNALRAFSRFYTHRLGVLQEGLLGSDYSLTEVRVMFELAHAGTSSAAAIREILGLDAGYLSRMLRRFAQQRLITRERSPQDARSILLRLTRKGQTVFNHLDKASSAEVAAMLRKLSSGRQKKLVTALKNAEEAFSGESEAQRSIQLRTHKPGDIGWVIERHGAIYAQEYGWDESFEALVAEIAAQFLKNFDAARERCWIAEIDGERVGSIFLVKQTYTIAKLRMLLLEPHARGLGLGRRLVDECMQFARSSGYRKITLWTQSNLLAARKLYHSAGFKLIKQEPQRAFGADLVSETWELDL